MVEKVMTLEDKSSSNSMLHAERVKFLEFIEKLSKMLKMEKTQAKWGYMLIQTLYIMYVTRKS